MSHQIACPICFKELLDEEPNTIKCSNCDLNFHNDCFKNPETQKPKRKKSNRFKFFENAKEKIRKSQPDEPVCDQCLAILAVETELTEIRNNTEKLKEGIKEIEKDPNRPMRVTVKSKILNPMSLTNILLFIILAIFTAWLVWSGWASTPQVSIQYNVGEIIGGLLAGVGVLAAGVTYSLKAMGKLD